MAKSKKRSQKKAKALKPMHEPRMEGPPVEMPFPGMGMKKGGSAKSKKGGK